DAQALEFAIVENVQRQDLTPLEEAEGYRRLIEDFQHTQEDLARAFGKSRSYIANTLRLLSLPQGVKKLLDEGKLTAEHARTLMGVDEAEKLGEQMISRGLNVRQAERLVQQAKLASVGGRRKAAAPDG